MTRAAELHLWLLLLAMMAISPISMYGETSCAWTNEVCHFMQCCRSGDVCMTRTFREDDGLLSTRCITWRASLIIYPRLLHGETCTDSFQCVDRCCREYRRHRHAIMLVCGSPFDGLEWHTCVTRSA